MNIRGFRRRLHSSPSSYTRYENIVEDYNLLSHSDSQCDPQSYHDFNSVPATFGSTDLTGTYALNVAASISASISTCSSSDNSHSPSNCSPIDLSSSKSESVSPCRFSPSQLHPDQLYPRTFRPFSLPTAVQTSPLSVSSRHVPPPPASISRALPHIPQLLNPQTLFSASLAIVSRANALLLTHEPITSRLSALPPRIPVGSGSSTSAPYPPTPTSPESGSSSESDSNRSLNGLPLVGVGSGRGEPSKVAHRRAPVAPTRVHSSLLAHAVRVDGQELSSDSPSDFSSGGVNARSSPLPLPQPLLQSRARGRRFCTNSQRLRPPKPLQRAVRPMRPKNVRVPSSLRVPPSSPAPMPITCAVATADAASNSQRLRVTLSDRPVNSNPNANVNSSQYINELFASFRARLDRDTSLSLSRSVSPVRTSSQRSSRLPHAAQPPPALSVHKFEAHIMCTSNEQVCTDLTCL